MNQLTNLGITIYSRGEHLPYAAPRWAKDTDGEAVCDLIYGGGPDCYRLPLSALEAEELATDIIYYVGCSGINIESLEGEIQSALQSGIDDLVQIDKAVGRGM